MFVTYSSTSGDIKKPLQMLNSKEAGVGFFMDCSKATEVLAVRLRSC